MPARVIARTCYEGKCPTMIRTESGDIAVQGYNITSPETELPVDMVIPAGESVVVIPADMFQRLVQQYLDEQAVSA